MERLQAGLAGRRTPLENPDHDPFHAGRGGSHCFPPQGGFAHIGRQFVTSSFSRVTYGHLTKSRSRYNKQFTEKMWPEITGRGTPSIEYFKPDNLYNHPSILNHLTRLGGRPARIHIREINQQPDNSVMTYLKTRSTFDSIDNLTRHTLIAC